MSGGGKPWAILQRVVAKQTEEADHAVETELSAWDASINPWRPYEPLNTRPRPALSADTLFCFERIAVSFYPKTMSGLCSFLNDHSDDIRWTESDAGNLILRGPSDMILLLEDMMQDVGLDNRDRKSVVLQMVKHYMPELLSAPIVRHSSDSDSTPTTVPYSATPPAVGASPSCAVSTPMARFACEGPISFTDQLTYTGRQP